MHPVRRLVSSTQMGDPEFEEEAGSNGEDRAMIDDTISTDDAIHVLRIAFMRNADPSRRPQILRALMGLGDVLWVANQGASASPSPNRIEAALDPACPLCGVEDCGWSCEGGTEGW